MSICNWIKLEDKLFRQTLNKGYEKWKIRKRLQPTQMLKCLFSCNKII